MARLGLGINIALHGWTRIPRFAEFSGKLHEQFSGTFLPGELLRYTACGIVTAESILGFLLLLGLFLRPALIAGQGLMCVLLFGACLTQNWSVAGDQLIYLGFFAVLLATRSQAVISLDQFRKGGATPAAAP